MTIKEREEFRNYLRSARVAINDLYAGEDKEIMKEKLKHCTTSAQISNVMAWGRKNILCKY